MTLGLSAIGASLQRYRAYEESSQPKDASAPAACALGSHGGPFVLHCCIENPADAIENPVRSVRTVSTAIRPARSIFLARSAMAR